jgi:hypothetical protein
MKNLDKPSSAVLLTAGFNKKILYICIAWLMFLTSLYSSSLFAQENTPIKLSWLGGEVPGAPTGVSWGIPLAEGNDPHTTYILKDEKGQLLPLQSWPMAYWPDGSLKWVAFSTVVDSNSGATFELHPDKKVAGRHLNTKIELSENVDDINVDCGDIQYTVSKQGQHLFKSIKIDDREISSSARLVCILQNGPTRDVGIQPSREEYIGSIENVTIEQKGPIRVVLKIEGRHASESGNRSWLPFIVRLYFYAGQQTVRMMHTIIYDGDQERDFIRGLGIVFDVPLNEQLYNRHIRFSGENSGFWDEPCQPLNGRIPLYSEEHEDLYARQLKGIRIHEQDTFSEQKKFLLDNWPVWNDFKLQQLNADGFRIQKRTNDHSAWIGAGYGKRSSGMAFAGDVSGGLAVTVRDFWQSFPSALEVRDMRTDKGKINAWLWSPEADAMDMRHYDTLAWGHTLEASYEDVQPGLSTATGVARTSEILLYASADVPSLITLDNIVKLGTQPPLLCASPEYIHGIPVLGIWSLPDRSSKGKQWIENQLDNAFEYYQLEVEQRHWYGFWNFGDVRHGYDRQRHTWKYDMGGYSWDNTELMPNLWLWYSYLRSGDADVFRMAEAMTRHTGEVDVYHLGSLKGLGSRHNVRHWGGGAKEVRISQAALSRFYYYFTTDERTGDLMRASVEASNEAIGKLDPLRLILEKSAYPTHARVGPDWFALVGNWMTEWERTGDKRYRDRIMVGVNSFSEMPFGFYSGVTGAFGYDPQTYKMYQLEKDHIGFSHLSVLMGGPEIAYELSHLLKDKTWDSLWMQFCKLYAASEDVIKDEFGVEAKLGNPAPWYARLPAYYAHKTGNDAYAARAWEEFFAADSRWQTNFDMVKFEGPESLQPIYEIPGVSTNNTAQWCLNAIQLLQLIGDKLPEDNPRLKDSN